MATIALELRKFGRARTNLHGVIASFLLVLGLYFPTSIGEQFSTTLLSVNYLGCFVLLSLLFFEANDKPGFLVCLSLLSIAPLLLVFTYSSGLHTYAFGALGGYAVLSLLLITNLRESRLPSSIFYLFGSINVINVFMGAAILGGSDFVKQILTKHYSVYYPELVPSMLLFRKPILTFGTHSIAAFFLYLFFYANLQTYRFTGKKLFLIFAFCYLFLTAAVLSVSGLILAAVGALQLFWLLWSSLRRRWFWAGALLAVLGLIAGLQLLDSIVKNWFEVREGAKTIITSSDNGFLGRLAPGGTLRYSIEYLRYHPFSPVGVSNKEGLMFQDSGLVEYLLRGSVILVFLVYGGLFFFLRRSLLSKVDAHWLFLVILGFELGFTALTNFRALYLLPFLVMYLNALRRSEADPAGHSHRLDACCAG
jgi:hypothetical protein